MKQWIKNVSNSSWGDNALVLFLLILLGFMANGFSVKGIFEGIRNANKH